LCLALLAGVFMSVQSAGSTSTGHSGGSQLVLQTAGGLCIRHSEESPLGLLNAGNLINPAALTIVTHPADVTDCEDHVVTFRVVVNGGTAPVTFTWQRKQSEEPDFTDIPSGSPNITYPSPGTLRVDNVGGFENPGGSRYRVKVTDALGSLTSNDALLTVNEITDIIPSVVFPSKTQVILCEGASFSYSVTTSGTPPVAYQWKKYLSPGIWVNVTDNSIISGSQTAVLAFNGGTPAESGAYKVNITFHASGADCHVSSDSRSRRVTFQGNPVAPVILQPPAACLGLLPDLMTAEAASGGSGSFRYQWQESWDGKVWNDIPGADTLSYQPPVSVADAWYRLTAIDTGLVSCGNVTSSVVLLSTADCFNFHYRSQQDGAWHDRTIWETSADGITWCGSARTYPTDQVLSTHIRPGHLVEVTQDVSVARVTVEAGGAVTIAEGVTLTNTDPEGASGFLVNALETAHGSLLCQGNFSGEIQVRKYFDPSRWTIMASPLEVTTGFEKNAPAVNFYAPANDYDLGWYREEGNEGWIYFPTLPSVLEPGRGYVIRTAATGTPEEGMITFSGTLNGALNNTVSPAVYCTAPRHGWNAVGNPFTPAIGITAFASTAENFLARNADILEDTYGAVYLWNQTGEYDGSQQYYRAIGNSGYHYEGFSYYGGEDPDYLQSGQGFLINVKGNGVAIFSRAMQTHAPEVRLKSGNVQTVSQFKNDCKYLQTINTRTQCAPGWYGLTLEAEAGARVRRTVVAFHESMTTGVDKTFDAGLLSSDNFRLYTRLVGGDQGTDLEIQCLPNGLYGTIEIPVGLDLPEGGVVIFRTVGVTLPKGWMPLFDDRVTNISTPLCPETGEYRATLPPSTCGKGRFYLRFGSSLIETGNPEAVLKNHSRFSVYGDGNNVIITGMPGQKSMAALYRMDGIKLEVFHLEHAVRNVIPLNGVAAGIYLLEITDNRGRKTFPVVVH